MIGEESSEVVSLIIYIKVSLEIPCKDDQDVFRSFLSFIFLGKK